VTLSSTLVAAAALVLSASSAGCYVEARPAPPVYGYGAVYADDVPYDLESYPHVWYQGRWAYFVGGRWYYPSTYGWVIFADEPWELHRHRTFIQSSPSYWGPHHPGGVYVAPPSHPYVAPPAHKYVAPPAKK